MKLQNFAENQWVSGADDGNQLRSAIDGSIVATIDTTGINFKGMLNYARRVGGPNLRQYTFHERALMLKKLAQYLMKGKKEFYDLSTQTGATQGVADKANPVAGAVAEGLFEVDSSQLSVGVRA